MIRFIMIRHYIKMSIIDALTGKIFSAIDQPAKSAGHGDDE